MVSRLREIEVSAAATKRLMDQNDTMLEELRKVKLAHEAATSKPRRSWKSASIDEPLTTGFANHILKRKRRPRRLPALGQDPSPPSRAGRPSTSTSSETAVEHVDESALRRREAVSQRGELAVRTSDATQEKDGEEPEKEMSFTAAGCLLDGALDDRHEAARFAQAVVAIVWRMPRCDVRRSKNGGAVQPDELDPVSGLLVTAAVQTIKCPAAWLKKQWRAQARMLLLVEPIGAATTA
ncbi:hypothetical protein FOZ61_002204 [Perkinsus olseni]|uniref:Uncharacterized protein n=1 Tax=Perkinsus olseni TaxID=32597 RepID=A0A7J6MF02_PEROL|nr:hypothetical protein FOZ61_002204 [Perkinsus olseni]